MNIKNSKVIETKTFSYTPLNPYLSESLLSQADGVLGLEYFLNSDKEHLLLFSQALRITGLNDSRQIAISMDDYKNMTCYTMNFYKTSCFPFMLNQHINIWDKVKHQIHKHINDEQVFIQLLLRKKHRELWQGNLQQQYNDYLQGIEYPTKNNIIRNLQYKILDFISTKEEWVGANPEIPYATQKFLEDGYEVDLRFAIYNGTKESRHKLSQKIKLAFSNLNYGNSWIMSEQWNKKSILQNMQLRRFPIMYREQILCISELHSFFSEEERVNMEVDEESETAIPVNIPIIVEEKSVLNTGNILSIMPVGQPSEKREEALSAKKLNGALNKLNLINKDVVVQDVHFTSTVQRVAFNLPNGLTLSKLKKSVEDIQTELALNDIGIEQGEDAGTVTLSIPLQKRETVFLRNCLESSSFQEYLDKCEIPILLGVDSNTGEISFTCLTKIKHLLIAGTTGSGKSVFLNCLLLSMMIYKNPKELQFIMIDPKMVELGIFEKYPHVLKVITDMNMAEKTLLSVTGKMDARYEDFKKKGYRNIQHYNKNEKDKMPYLVVVIEELADLIMTNKDVEGHIIRLAQKARAAGIHLIICTQRPQKEVMTGLIKSNIYSRVCFACSSGIDYKVAIDSVLPFTLLGRGDGVYRFEGMQGIPRFQAPAIGKDDNEQDKIIDHFSNHWKGNFKKEVIQIEEIGDDEPEKEVSDMDKLKQVIAETGETRISELQKIMKVRTSRIQELFPELEKQGWIRYTGVKSKGYELLISEVDRKRYLKEHS